MKRIAIAFVLVVLTGLLSIQSAQALQFVWDNLGTDYNTAINWTPDTIPSGSNVAVFDTPATVQPNLSLSVSVAGLFFRDTDSGGYTITNTGGAAFTLTGTSTSGAGGTANGSAAAIRSETTATVNQINAPLILAPASGGTQSTFFQASNGLLFVSGAVSGAGINLSLRGGGSILLSAANSHATTSIDAANTTLILGNDGALGAGTFSINSTATVQTTGGNRTVANAVVFGGNTTISGTNAITFNGDVRSSGSSSRAVNVTNTGGATFNGSVFLEEAGAPAGRIFTLGGSQIVTINGVVQDGSAQPAGLRYNGTSTLTLANTNTYSGGTLLGGGTTIVTQNGGLGTGNVSLTAAAVTLTLQGAVNNYISDTANLNIQFTDDIVNLNYSGTDTISSLTIAGVQEAPGIYGSAASGAPNVRPELFGTGTLTVLTMIPEPATYMLFGLGVLVCAQQFRRKKAK